MTEAAINLAVNPQGNGQLLSITGENKVELLNVSHL